MKTEDGEVSTQISIKKERIFPFRGNHKGMIQLGPVQTIMYGPGLPWPTRPMTHSVGERERSRTTGPFLNCIRSPLSSSSHPRGRSSQSTGDAVLRRLLADVGRAGCEPGTGGSPRHGHRRQRAGALRLQPQRRLPALPRVAPPAPHPRPNPGPQAHVRAPLLPPIVHRQDRPDHVRPSSHSLLSPPTPSHPL